MVVEVVAVRQHDDGRVRHVRVAHDLPDVEEHLQALPAALSVPDDPRPAILPLHRCEGRVDGLVDGVELVVLGKALDDHTVLVREADEVPHEVQEASGVEHSPHEDLHLGGSRLGQPLAIDRLPRGIVLVGA